MRGNGEVKALGKYRRDIVKVILLITRDVYGSTWQCSEGVKMQTWDAATCSCLSDLSSFRTMRSRNHDDAQDKIGFRSFQIRVLDSDTQRVATSTSESGAGIFHIERKNFQNGHFN